MIFKIRIGHWRFTFTFAPVTNVIGVNSKLPNGNHILMWDFDNTVITYVIDALQHIQNIYALPNIYILETKPKSNYIAYCFMQNSFRRTVEIIATTKGVDPNFFKYGVYRERFTLRVTPKCGRKPKLAYIMKSHIPENCFVTDLKSWVKYETLSDNFKPMKVSIGEPKNN